jgi:hypothetical protein
MEGSSEQVFFVATFARSQKTPKGRSTRQRLWFAALGSSIPEVLDDFVGTSAAVSRSSQKRLDFAG